MPLHLKGVPFHWEFDNATEFFLKKNSFLIPNRMYFVIFCFEIVGNHTVSRNEFLSKSNPVIELSSSGCAISKLE